SIAVEAAGEVAALKDNINAMIRNLKDTTRINTEQDWLKTNLTRFTRLLQGQRDLLAVAQMILSELAPLVNVQHGVLYLNEADANGPIFRLFASYGFKERKQLSSYYRPREGLIGQCAFEKQRILLTDVPEDYIKISSGLGEASPLNIVVLPVVFESEILAIIELASFQRFNETHLAFLDQLTESIGIVLNTIAATNRTEELLKQSQTLALELQSQQQELTESNKRLEYQAQNLRASEERLKLQQDELQQTNEELEEKARLLALQNAAVERKNQEIDLARKALEEKAAQLALTSKYKSEFLANMSHELRTPLNSLLILSKVLAENEQGNLTDKQVEFASTVYAAGSDLLNLINDILDLSKIEAGKVDLEWQPLRLDDLAQNLDRTFRPLAESKGNAFSIRLDSNLPDRIYTDEKRLQQVLKNLVSNAMKFTHQGEVSLEIGLVSSGWSADSETLGQTPGVLAFSVHDTGIGIEPDKQKIIFEAFQQADGTTSRKYGGTGLGLSISREIAHLLGGEIGLVSQPGAGSTFTLYVPCLDSPPHQRLVRGLATAPPAAAPVAHQLPLHWNAPEAQRSSDPTVLIVEDDAPFARILQDVAQEKGFKSVLVTSGEEALDEVLNWQPTAILLDLYLPGGMDGWAVLSRLQEDPRTRQIPVHIISVSDETQRSLQQGAVLHLAKPVSKEQLLDLFAELENRTARQFKKLLVVHSDEAERQQLRELLAGGDLQVTALGTGTEALKALDAELFDCLVMDVSLEDMSGIELLERLRSDQDLVDLPVLVYASRELSESESERLREISDSIILKGNRSPERLQAEVALFLHDVHENRPIPLAGGRIKPKSAPDSSLAGRKVLLVDDDVRNIFALSSILESQQMEVVSAENGRMGIQILQQHPDIDIVLMDVMMPEMDGYETTAAIRQLPEFKTLPIIAITAKAMKGDREKCLEAGASDYITKPVDIEQLLSLMRVWLGQRV
ncbi:MAG: response regulator, partial [Candidatus Sericytochromatia bacterium]